MKVSSVIIFLCTLKLSRGAYQVGKESATFKQAIEKATKAKIADFTKSLANDEAVKLDASLFQGGLTLPPELSSWKHQGPAQYWFHPQIHTLGNTGLFGGLHSAMCPLATYLIDVAAYSGANVREFAAKKLRSMVTKSNARIADLCCGVGMSTRALLHAFTDASLVVGIDTSPEMISMARLFAAESAWWDQLNHWHDQMALGVRQVWTDYVMEHGNINNNKNINNNNQHALGTTFPVYHVANAEATPFPGCTFDLVTIMYAFHEAPLLGRYRMLREVRRLLCEGGTLAIVDISPKYNPSPTMLAGEPYVMEYKENIHCQLAGIRGFANVSYMEIVPRHVGVWLLTRQTETPTTKQQQQQQQQQQSMPFLGRWTPAPVMP